MKTSERKIYSQRYKSCLSTTGTSIFTLNPERVKTLHFLNFFNNSGITFLYVVFKMYARDPRWIWYW